ncbi:proton-coupled folate transporter-like [Ptychodera flava]|uniref:proton-coupled folate transporter-like n=1 Tax=Ptychodera flava TaxID=63121 RepID=UPI003969C69B
MANLMSYLRLVTVEPVMFLNMLGSFLQYTSVQHLIYEKTCMQLYNSSICDNLTHHKEEEEQVQTGTSHWLIYLNLVQTVPSILTALFLGSWSDRIGRKIPMTMPCIAAMIYAVILIVSSVYIWLPVPYILIGSFLLGCTGGFITTTFTVYSYMADITDKETRTRRVGIVESMTFLGSTIGLLCGGIMIDNVGFVPVFIFYGALSLTTFLYILLWLKESVQVKQTMRKQHPDASPGNVQADNQDIQMSKAEKKLCRELCRLENVKKSLCVCFKKRLNSGRLHLLLLAMTLLLFQLVGSGDSDVTVLYTKKDPLGWSSSLTGYYLALTSFLKGLCLLTVLPLLTSKTTLHDTTIAMIGTIFRMGAYVMIAFSTETWMMFIVPVLMSMAGIPAASVRSLLSKVINADEQGSLFSFMAACESLISFIASFIFNSLYPATLHILNGGLVYILMAIILGISLVLLFMTGYSMRQITNYYGTLHEENPADEDGANGSDENSDV